MDDSEIVDLYLERNEQAIHHTQLRYGERLRRIAYGIVKNRETARECENDTYMQAWNGIPPHEPREYLFSFLARIVRHVSIDVCRKEGRGKRNARIVPLTVELEQCISGSEDSSGRLDGIVLGQVISAYLWQLPAEQRMVFLRRYWYMDSVAQIARRFSCSQSRIKSMLFRCRAGLRDYLIKEGYSV